jgi:hypothetical protein
MISFAEYIEDVLDLHVGLMSEEDLTAAREGYARFIAPKPSNPKHPDMKMSAADLIARCKRLVDGQAYAVAKFAGQPGYETAVIAAKEAIAEGRRILAAKRPTKADLIAHAQMNSAASRAMNAATQSAA